MKRHLTLIFLLLSFIGVQAQTQQANQDSSKASFYSAFDALKNMLEGKDSLNYEKAVFITENAYYNNALDYSDFKEVIDFHVGMINILASNARTEYDKEYQKMKIYPKKMFMLNTSNWAIFKYITDTTFFIQNNLVYYKSPFTYTYDDPYGSTNWENTQDLHLLTHDQPQGNCYALASLFKIFSDRMKSDARLTVAPHHIYIQNRDAKGDFYNVELASKTFPPDGSIQTYTYTTKTSIMNGMSQRMLTDKEAVVLNLIYLAKGYEHKYHENTNDFLLNCAELAYKYDTLSLNALLLKAEVTENRLLNAMKENNIKTVTQARNNKKTNALFANYEGQLNNLYKLGYREIPKNIENMILATIQHKTEGSFIPDKTPNPFNDIQAKQRYATLSWGMFDELQENVDTAQYYHALLNTETKKIVEFLPIDNTDNYKADPVVFAMSIDPLVKKYPDNSPYVFVANNPILFIDKDGREVFAYTPESQQLVIKTLNYAFGGSNCFGFEGNKLVNDGDPPKNMTSQQALLYKYFSETIMVSKTPTLVNTDENLIAHNEADGKMEVAEPNPNGCRTTYFDLSTTSIYEKPPVQGGIGQIRLTGVSEPEQVIQIPKDVLAKGIGLEMQDGPNKLFPAYHALLHEIAHGIMNTIMKEMDGKFNGQDFNKMTKTERSDWAIQYTNTLLQSLKQPLESGGGQHDRKPGVNPDKKPDPITK
jgi:hypothetical protein